MNLKTIAALALTVISTTSWAGAQADAKCGAGSCGKKTTSSGADAGGAPEGACSKKDEGHEAACSKKEASCSKKEASCSKK